MIPVTLTIAGSDCSSGAGLQADLKTFQAFGTFGLTALTAAVSETPLVVEQVHDLPPAFVRAQIALLRRSYPIAAAKVGMLSSTALIKAVHEALFPSADPASFPLVIDPVMVATAGGQLLHPEALEALSSLLLPRSTLVTPNLFEAAALLGWAAPLDASPATMELAASQLATQFSTSVLIKGGHATDPLVARDVLSHRGKISWFEERRIPDTPTHGTGCTLSAAIAAGLALGLDLPDAIARAKRFVTGAIAGAHRWHGPSGPIYALDQR
jgi:hydroxymethylpyrimidine/phosphomethylpyrimidine kinase